LGLWSLSPKLPIKEYNPDKDQSSKLKVLS